jgi:hypothetical protein
MPWKNNRSLLKDVDKLPHGADWSVQAIELAGNRGTEVVEFWSRNSLQVVKDILANKQLGQHMEYQPVRKYTSLTREERIRNEMNSADFMWDTQVPIIHSFVVRNEMTHLIQNAIPDPYATVVCCVASSDETKLTNFSGDKKAHPVYITVANLPKHLRRRISKRANILLGYLPVPKLDCESDKDKRREIRRNLFHQCMEQLMRPLAEACKEGEETLCSEKGVRRIYPVLASYVADYPEQCKVVCTLQLHCPSCTVRPEKRGDLGNSQPRTRDQVIAAMDEREATGSAAFNRLRLYDVRPFWENHPYINIGSLLTPDLLHQLHKGVMKDHLTKWVTHILGKQVIDECHTSMPEYHGMRHFKHEISSVSQWTGRELKEMAKILLPVVSDADGRVVAAACALLDYMYLSHSSSLKDTELDAMDKALCTFHENKSIFKIMGAVTTSDVGRVKGQIPAPAGGNLTPRTPARARARSRTRECENPGESG